ncbi:MAG: bifunctional 4-hydroxy-2-oxoglutarate aldolase/2-dehydro-3-deoxy-phosphogluconate aldolase [Phycisphaerales bacterium]|nr:MAG: bifunctional 4-hydroxy-2-oxoglutarate aldolase/2-dehydro-3-deoxy-phosphogluconate aldolase [Phycisphaerales bacterium]
MAEGRRARIIATIERERVSAIIRTDDQKLAQQAMTAAVDGGLRLIEFTMTTPGALELIEEFAQREGVTVGGGTVMTPTMARDAVAAGAEFLVSPTVDREVIAEAALLDVPSIPGTYTPTEMESAHRWGADFVKLFPAPAGGVEFIRSVLGPLPHLRIFPTAGVTPENFAEFLDAGCAGVGFVRSLFDPADMAARDFAAIRERASDIMRRLQEWRSSR